MSKGERRKIFLIFLIILFSDQFTKFFILKFLFQNQSITIIKNIFYLTLVRNRGAAFGIFKDSNFLLIIISLIAVILISINLKKCNSKLKIPLVLILAGAMGNLIDRLKYGYVVDFLDFRIWPVFNIADSSITIGAILLGYSLLKSKIKNVNHSLY